MKVSDFCENDYAGVHSPNLLVLDGMQKKGADERSQKKGNDSRVGEQPVKLFIQKNGDKVKFDMEPNMLDNVLAG